MEAKGRPFSRVVYAAVFTASVALSVVAGVAVLLIVFLGGHERLAWRLERAHDVEEAQCGKCHAADRPHLYAKSPEAWRKTVHGMLTQNKSLGDPAKEKAIADMIIHRRSLTPGEAFRNRCGSCHDAKVVDAYLGLSDRALEMLVRGHVIEHNYAVRTWEGEMVLEYLKQRRAQVRPGSSVAAGDPESQDLFEYSCRACHTISFSYKSMFEKPRTDAQWSEVVERMRQKAPDTIGSEDAPRLVRQIIRMRDERNPVK